MVLAHDTRHIALLLEKLGQRPISWKDMRVPRYYSLGILSSRREESGVLGPAGVPSG